MLQTNRISIKTVLHNSLANLFLSFKKFLKKLSLSMLGRHKCGMKVQLYWFLSSVLDEGRRIPYCPGHLMQANQLRGFRGIAGWECCRTGVGVWEKGQLSLLGIEPHFIHPGTCSDWSIPATTLNIEPKAQVDSFLYKHILQLCFGGNTDSVREAWGVSFQRYYVIVIHTVELGSNVMKWMYFVVLCACHSNLAVWCDG